MQQQQKWKKSWERQKKKNMKKENNTNESDFKENEIPDLVLWSLLNLNQKQTLSVVAVMMRKKVLNIK